MVLKKLPDICHIQYGYAFDSSNFSESEGVPLVRIRDVVRGYSETYTTERCGDEYIVQNGDMLIGMDGEFNIARWKGGKAYLNQRVCRLIPKDDVEALYLFYFMPSALKAIEEKTPFVTVKHLSARELNKVLVPVPLVEEQQRIANKLKNVDDLISFRQEQLEKLDELVKSRFIELFGDESYPQIPLIQLIVEGAGLSYGIIVPGDNIEDGVPMVRPSDFNNGELCLDKVYRVAPEIEAKYTRTRLIGNEILVQVIGQPGQIMLSDSRCKGMNVTRNLAVVRPDCNRINRIYLKTYMQSQEAQAFMLGETKQSTLKQLPLSRLKELEIPVPPMELQEQFAAFVEQTDKSKLAIQESLAELETLKKALMQKYFG